MSSLYGRLLACGFLLSLASCGSDAPLPADTPSMPSPLNSVVGPAISPPCTSGGNPRVSMVFPSSFATLSGTVVLRANAIDDGGVAELRFYVDDKLVGIASAGTQELPWNTQAVPNGLHQIQARAFDGCQNQGFSESVTVSVRN